MSVIYLYIHYFHHDTLRLTVTCPSQYGSDACHVANWTSIQIKVCGDMYMWILIIHLDLWSFDIDQQPPSHRLFMNLIYSLLKRGIIKCQLVRLSLSKFMSIYHSSLHNFYHNLSMQHVINSRFMWFHNTTRHNLLLNKLSFILYLNSDIVKCPLVRLLISKCLSIYQSNFHKFYHNLFT